MVEPAYQWQVVRVALDPTRGSEQAGERPALIVSRESINEALTIVSILPITTRRSGRRVYSTEALLPAGTAGLPNESLAMAQQIRTIAKERILQAYGRLEDGPLQAAVKSAIRVYLDLEG
jgi:mRNA interferase MazF